MAKQQEKKGAKKPAKAAAAKPAKKESAPKDKKNTATGKIAIVENPAKVVNKLGEKRACQSCSTKFYDLNKSPIICPKCGSEFDPEALLKPKRGRKKAVEKVEIEEIDLELEDAEDTLLEAEEEAANELDEEIREEIIGDDEDSDSSDADRVLDGLEDEAEEILGADDEPHVDEK